MGAESHWQNLRDNTNCRWRTTVQALHSSGSKEKKDQFYKPQAVWIVGTQFLFSTISILLLAALPAHSPVFFKKPSSNPSKQPVKDAKHSRQIKSTNLAILLVFAVSSFYVTFIVINYCTYFNCMETRKELAVLALTKIILNTY